MRKLETADRALQEGKEASPVDASELAEFRPALEQWRASKKESKSLHI
jgi:hypothetical protein